MENKNFLELKDQELVEVSGGTTNYGEAGLAHPVNKYVKKEQASHIHGAALGAEYDAKLRNIEPLKNGRLAMSNYKATLEAVHYKAFEAEVKEH